MPADTKAVAYFWYFDVPEEDREIRAAWKPDGEFLSSMTMGFLQMQVRDPKTKEFIDHHVAMQVPWVVAESVARKEGFAVEVPVYPEPTEPGEDLPDVSWKPSV